MRLVTNAGGPPAPSGECHGCERAGDEIREKLARLEGIGRALEDLATAPEGLSLKTATFLVGELGRSVWWLAHQTEGEYSAPSCRRPSSCAAAE